MRNINVVYVCTYICIYHTVKILSTSKGIIILQGKKKSLIFSNVIKTANAAKSQTKLNEISSLINTHQLTYVISKEISVIA